MSASVQTSLPSIRFRQRRLRRVGWLCVLGAIALNVVLFGAIALVNRTFLNMNPPEELSAIEIVAPPPIEKVRVEPPQPEPEQRPEQQQAEPEPMKQQQMTERFEPRLSLSAVPTDVSLAPTVVEAEPAPVAAPTGPMELTAVDRGPRGVYTPPTPYPRWAQVANKEATVEVRFVVRPDGSVANVVVHRLDGDRRFEAAVLQAVRRWRFEPGIYRGRPVAVRCRKTIRFRLEG